MTATIATRSNTINPWQQFCEWVTSTDNRIYVGWFGVLAAWFGLYCGSGPKMTKPTNNKK